MQRSNKNWNHGARAYCQRPAASNPGSRSPLCRFISKKLLAGYKLTEARFARSPQTKGNGPVYISAGYLRKQYLRETVDGAFTEVSDNELMWSLISAYDLLRSLCDRAFQNHLIDVGTMNFILQPLRDLGFRNPSKASLPAVLSCLGKIRYLVKLHKPGCKLRRVEVDTRSPFNNLTIFVSSILRKVVRICETTVMDSKTNLVGFIGPSASTRT